MLTYFYSESYRTDPKETEVLNKLSYTKKRELVDFCGLDNNVVDKMFTGVTFNDEQNPKNRQIKTLICLI